MRNPVVPLRPLMAALALCCMPYCIIAQSRSPQSERHNLSGIQGQAVISVNVTLDGTVIAGTPVQTHVRVMTSKGRFVTSFVTALDGTFSVILKPGDYFLVPDSPPNPYLLAMQTPVQVQKKQFTTVTIGYWDRPL